MPHTQEDAFRFMLARHLDLVAEGETNTMKPLPEDFEITAERAAEIEAELNAE